MELLHGLKYKYPNPAIKGVIPSEARNLSVIEKIATHLSGARNDNLYGKGFCRLSLDLGINPLLVI
jgi:hypothetical protein